MLKAINKRIRNKKGFTLVELIVVIAVLGILAAVAVPRITGVQDKAKEKADLANLKVLNNAVEMYYAEHGEYPREDTIQNFEADMSDYLPADGIPACQQSGHIFVYDADASGQKVTIEEDTDTSDDSLIISP